MALNYNPKIPVYAAPQTSFNNVNVDAKEMAAATDAMIDPSKATVAGQMGGLLAENSAYMQANVAGAQRAAASRGLMNTSMAAGEGQKAAIESALPIAQQDAGLYGGIATQNAKAISDSMLNNQIGALDYNKSITNAKITGALEQQSVAGKFELQKLADFAQMQRVEVDNAFKLQMNNDSLDSAERQQLMTTQTALGQELQGGIERILRDTNISGTVDVKDPKTGKVVKKDAKQVAIEQMISGYKSSMNTAAAVVGLKLSWT